MIHNMKIFNTDFRNVSQSKRGSDISNVLAWQKELLFDFIALLKLPEIFRDRFISTALKIMAGSHFDHFFQSQQTAAQGELLRQQNGEKMQLERELARTEQEAFDSTLNDLEQNRRKTVDTMMDALALKLQGQCLPKLLFLKFQ